MILVDTSIWIDHLHRAEPELAELLEQDRVGCHPLVIEELALGSIAGRAEVLTAIGQLLRTKVASHREMRAFVDANRLWARGLGAVDAHLLAACAITPDALLWTRAKRLRDAARELHVAYASRSDRTRT